MKISKEMKELHKIREKLSKLSNKEFSKEIEDVRRKYSFLVK